MREHKRHHVSRPVLIAILALALALGTGIGTAWAYFTTYATAKGSYTLKLGDTTDIEETVVEGKKEVSISVSEDSQPVFIRAKGYCGSEYSLSYDGGGNWTENTDANGEKWWYYNTPVEARGKTEKLIINILDKDGNKIDASKIEDGHQFNINVVYETTPAVYNEEGTATANWDKDVTVNRTITQ